MHAAEKLLDLLMSDDAALAAQGEELLASHESLHDAVFGPGGAAWQTMARVRFMLGRQAPYPGHRLADLCRWGIECAQAAEAMLEEHASESHPAALTALKGLAFGVPPDSPVAIFELLRRLDIGLASRPLTPDIEELQDSGDLLRQSMMEWIQAASMLEEPSPDDDIEGLLDLQDVAQGRVMYLWALYGAALQRIAAAEQGADILAGVIRWQSETF